MLEACQSRIDVALHVPYPMLQLTLSMHRERGTADRQDADHVNHIIYRDAPKCPRWQRWPTAGCAVGVAVVVVAVGGGGSGVCR